MTLRAEYGASTNPNSVRARERSRTRGAKPRRKGCDPLKITAAQQRADRKRRAARAALIDAAKSKPCADCGVQYAPHVMQFDHLDAKSKSFTIGQARARGIPDDVVRAEIAKCEVVCANCHFERTRRRRAA